MRPGDRSAIDAASPAPSQRVGRSGAAPALREAHQEELQRLFDFTPAELAANRAGQLAPGQWPLPTGLFMAATLITAALFLVGFLVRRAREAWRSGNDRATVRGLLLTIPVLGVGALVAVVLFVPLASDWVARRACSVEGVTLGYIDDPGKSNRGKIEIDHLDLRADDPGQHPALHVGERYRAYYACHSLELMSIEPLE